MTSPIDVTDGCRTCGRTWRALDATIKEPCPWCEVEWLWHGYHIRGLRIVELEAMLAAAASDTAELRQLFDLQWKRTQEADAKYVAAHPRPDCPHGYKPDLGALIEWLMTQAGHTESQLAAKPPAIDDAELAAAVEWLREFANDEMREEIRLGQTIVTANVTYRVRLVLDALAARGQETERLRAYVREQLCECVDEYGHDHVSAVRPVYGVG